MTDSPPGSAGGGMLRSGVLISSAGRRVALLESFRTALLTVGSAGGVVAVDSSPLSSAFHLADRSFLVPPCNEQGFTSAVLEICERESLHLVVPTIDTELLAYASDRRVFDDAGVCVAVSGPETVLLASDKVATHDWLVSKGFPTVSQTLVSVGGDLHVEWDGPAVAKPRFGSAGKGVGLFENVGMIDPADWKEDHVVQQKAPGSEYTVDIFVARGGEPLCAVPRRRIEVRAGEVSKGVTVRNPTIQGLAMDVCRELPEAFGAITVQIFFDESSGTMNIIEINARFGGGFPLACEAGANFPLWLLEEALGLPSSAAPDAWRSDLVMLRYDDAVFVSAASAGI